MRRESVDVFRRSGKRAFDGTVDQTAQRDDDPLSGELSEWHGLQCGGRLVFDPAERIRGERRVGRGVVSERGEREHRGLRDGRQRGEGRAARRIAPFQRRAQLTQRPAHLLRLATQFRRFAAREKFEVGGGQRRGVMHAPALHLLREERQLLAAGEDVRQAAGDPVAGAVAVVDQARFDAASRPWE